MIATNQKQMNLVAASSVSGVSNIDQVLDVANRLDRSSIGIDGRLNMLEQHLNQVVWLHFGS